MITEKIITEIVEILLENGFKSIGERDLAEINKKLSEWSEEGDKISVATNEEFYKKTMKDIPK